ncbi:MAG TPA: 50S ribosomal protein L30 [Thermoleophilaceae bacterium]
MAGSVRITQHRSASGASPRQRDTLRTLGLGRIGRSVERPDEPHVRGAIRAVRHLVRVDES